MSLTHCRVLLFMFGRDSEVHARLHSLCPSPGRETQELVARAPECSRGARRISLSGLEAGVTVTGPSEGRQLSAGGNRGAQESL